MSASSEAFKQYRADVEQAEGRYNQEVADANFLHKRRLDQIRRQREDRIEMARAKYAAAMASASATS